MAHRIRYAGVLALVAALAQPAAAQVVCPMGMIDVGDPQEAVLARCGPPTLVQEWDQTRVAEVDLPDGTFAEPVVVVPQPEWVYDFGPTRFRLFVRFENGVVRALDGGDVPLGPPPMERDIPDA